MKSLEKNLIIAFTILLLLPACSPAAPQNVTPEPISLKVNVLPFLSFAPFFIAQEEGFFAEQALNVEFTELSEPNEDIPALISGEIDVAAGMIWPNQLNAIARGSSLKLVAGKGYASAEHCPSIGVMVRPDLLESGALKDPAQLRGLKISLTSDNSISSYLVDLVLRRSGLTIHDLESVKIPVPSRPEAIENGALDIVTAAEPWITRMLQGEQAIMWFSKEQILPDSQHAFVYFGPNILEKNPDAGKRFMIAYLKAVSQYNQGKTERNLEIMSKYTKLDIEFLKQACWPAIHDDGQINAQSVLDFQAWGIEEGFLESSLTVEQFWDSSFIDYANEVLSAPAQ
ncbi:MAG: ABC transporter substrate-binding protein [Anaerolineales bacterium]|nr:ABC transporter substrate-binding protein [Anaerolineales bacterium]